MNRFRLIDEVSIYWLDRNHCHITLLYESYLLLWFIGWCLTGLCLYISVDQDLACSFKSVNFCFKFRTDVQSVVTLVSGDIEVKIVDANVI